MNPYVFFVGCPRSGTTLLRRIGDAHPELAVVRELHWVPLWWERRRGLTSDGAVTADLVRRLLKHSHFRRLEVEGRDVESLLDARRPKHYAAFVSELFDLHGRVRGKRLVGVKTPRYVRHLPTLAQLWPHVRVVHLIRDGRDVALSLLDWSRPDRWAGRFPTWDDDPLTTSALFWEWNVRLGRESQGLLEPGRYHELRYESLVTDPRRECERLCAFLGLEFEPAMLGFHEGRTRPDETLSAKKAWRPVTPGLRRWREALSDADAALFDAAAGELLDELGYERTSPPPSQEELAYAGRVRDVFAEHARSTGAAVPRSWEQVAA